MPQATNPTEATSQETTYQEIHGAIRELYRLMGVPGTDFPTAGHPFMPGYSVYTYPAPGGAAPAGFQAPGMPGWMAASGPPPMTPWTPTNPGILNQYGPVAAPPFASPGSVVDGNPWATRQFNPPC